MIYNEYNYKLFGFLALQFFVPSYVLIVEDHIYPVM